MSTGVFHVARSGASQAYRARMRRQRQIDRFAEELSNSSGRLHDVANALGISYGQAVSLFGIVRRDLGVPAKD